jgi:hypothetical protein
MTLKFSGLEVSLNILFVDLIDGQFTEEGLCLVESVGSIGLQDVPQAVGSEL